jgi:hypothetical protein
MRIAKLILPAVAIATVALMAPRANAQAMGEYATVTGTDAGATQTWGTSKLGASWSERASAISGNTSGFAAQTDQERWPESGLAQQAKSGEERFPESSDRFPTSENRFGQTSDFSSRAGGESNRWPESSFHDNAQGLDTSATTSGEDTSYDRTGLDTNYNSNP